MPVMKRPGRQVAPSFGSPGALPEYGTRQAAQQVGVSRQRFGAGIASLGGDFAELALRVHNTKVREEFEDAKITYDEGMLAFLTEQEKAQDYPVWEKNTSQKHDTASAEIENKMLMPQAKGKFSNWAQAERSVLMYKTVTRADRLSADKARSMIKVRMENAVKQGRVTDFVDYLGEMQEDGLLLEEEVDFHLIEVEEFAQRWNNMQAVEAATSEALSILESSGIDASMVYLKNILPHPSLDGADINKIHNLISSMDKLSQYVDEKKRLEDIRKEVTLFASSIRNNELDLRVIESAQMGVSQQKWWRNKLKNSVKAEPEINWRKFLDLQDTLFDHWNVDRMEYELAVVEARYGDDAYINDDGFDRLLKRIAIDMPRQYMVTLRTGFETIYRDGTKWKFGIHRDLNQEEAQRVAQAQSALLDWLLEDRISKKKETSPTEFYARSKELAAMFRPGAEPKRRVTPPAKRLPLNRLDNYLKQNKDAKPVDLMTDLRNAVKAVNEGRDSGAVFGRLLEVYKDRKNVQEFLTTFVRPLITEE